MTAYQDTPLNIPGGCYMPTQTCFVTDAIGQQWATSMSDVRIRPRRYRIPHSGCVGASGICGPRANSRMVSTAQKLVRNWSINSLDKSYYSIYTSVMRFDRETSRC